MSDSRVWNKAPAGIKLCTTLHLAKIEIIKILEIYSNIVNPK
jgi:hypothetical protein